MNCVAILPAYRAESTIADTLASLRLGNGAFVSRVLVVTSAQDPTAQMVRRWSSRDDRVQLVIAPSRMSAGVARNLGRAAAGPDTDLLLFVDADVRLEMGGAARLCQELMASGDSAVCARIVTEGGAVAHSRHILEFKEASSRRPAPSSWLPPSTVMLCRAAAFDRVGGFPDLWPGEDLVFSQSLRDCGEAVSRSDQVTAHHTHPRGFLEMLRHQWRLGSTAAHARRKRIIAGSVFARRRWLAPLLFPGRALRIVVWQWKEGTRARVRTAMLSPLLLLGLLVWTAGFVHQGPPGELR